jgi:hypothetical protein
MRCTLTTCSNSIATLKWKGIAVDSLRNSSNSLPVSAGRNQLSEAIVWARIFAREAQREMDGKTNDHKRAADQLRVMLRLFINK